MTSLCETLSSEAERRHSRRVLRQLFSAQNLATNVNLPFMKKAPQRAHAALVAQIGELDRAYYLEAQPLVSDQEYDRLYRELLELEAAHPELCTPASPSQRVGGAPLPHFKTVAHAQPMQSLDNTYSAEELGAFHDRVLRTLARTQLDFVVEPKIDGVAVSLRYERGRFVQGLTRGDGRQGDDITLNLRTIRSLPLAVSLEAEVFEVRGEVYYARSAFAALNRQRLAAGEPVFANPRNAAAGTLKQLDSALVAKRALAILLYGPGELRGISCTTQMEWLELLRQAGFPVPGGIQLARTKAELLAAITALDGARADYPFATDGAVVKLNDWRLRAALGATSKAPRWTIAYKYSAEKAITTLQAVTFQVGRTGTITPVAELQPVLLAGTTVARATLHNFEEIKRRDIRLHDQVTIEKAGEIIPAVLGPILPARQGQEREITPPENCPSCATPLVWEGIFLRCPNAGCAAQRQRWLRHFAQRGAMDIEGLGGALVEQLVQSGLARDPADLYDLTAPDLLKLERMAEKSAENVIQGIADSKERDLWRLLFGLGILHVGAGGARALATHFQNLERIAAATPEELQRVPDVGSIMAQSVADWFKAEPHRRLIDRLRQAGLNFTAQAIAPMAGTGPLLGKTVVITGTLSEPREAIAERIRLAGGKVATSVSKKTDYLVAGEEAGSKLAQAIKLGIAILDEAALTKLAPL